jgi:hypothetical protein
MTGGDARDSYQKINPAHDCGPSAPAGTSFGSGVAAMGLAIRSLGPHNRFIWIETYQTYHHSIEANRISPCAGLRFFKGT